MLFRSSGLVKVYKQKSDGATDATTPAGDFEDTKAENELIDIRLNNSFRKSKKIYKVQAGLVLTHSQVFVEMLCLLSLLLLFVY